MSHRAKRRMTLIAMDAAFTSALLVPHFHPPCRTTPKPALHRISQRRWSPTPNHHSSCLIHTPPVWRSFRMSSENGNREHRKKTDEEDGMLTTQRLAELDEIAEEWIGTNLARWEWYERVKARRRKLMAMARERDREFDEELEELKRAFMEIDAVFGTAMLDEDRKVTVAGWSVVGFVFLGYVVLGYWVFEWVVGALMGGWGGMSSSSF